MAFGFGLPAWAQPTRPDGIGEVAWQQIVALEQEKATRTPVQRKLDSHFVRELKGRRGELPAILATVPSHVRFETDGRTMVDIDADVTDELLQQIRQAGGTIISSVPRFRAIRAQVPVDALETLAASPNVTFIQQAVPARTRIGSVDDQGDITHGAVTARPAYGVDGSGIKVGVLSDSVKNLATSQSTGDLPTNVVVLAGQSGTSISGNEGEGTAMLEIVHDLAPGAQLYFATAFASEAGFAQNILSLRSNGCDIIVDDVGYFDEPPFQDGIVAQAVNSVTADGALYFSSAGNGGRLNAGTAAVWEGDFLDGGPVGSPLSGGHYRESGSLHSFGANNYDVAQGLGSSTFYVTLFWADPWGASTNDYDLFTLNATGTMVDDAGAGPQNGTQNPYEICTVKDNERIVVVNYQGIAAKRFLHLELESNGYGTLSASTAGDLRGHPAATNAFAVAAVDVHSAYPGQFNASNTNEYFSSDGPRRVFFQANGAPITPGNFTNTGGTVRLKPDISAADGASNSVAGFNPFYGTSAAAPHAAAIAALLWSYNPLLTPAQVRTALTSSAIDLGAPGWDRDAGYGIVMPAAAIQSLSSSNNPPTLAAITNKTVNELSLLTFTNSASDPDANALTFSLDPGAPTNAVVNPTNGVFSWTPTEAQGPATNSITVRVTDNGIPSMSATQTFIVTVNEVNQSPVLPAIANKTVLEQATVLFTNNATDADLPANALTYSLDPGAPTNAAVNPASGVFTWTPTEAQGPGTNVIVVRVTDNGTPTLSATQSFTVTVLESNLPPVLSAITNRSIAELATLTFTNTATDPDFPVQNLTFTLQAGVPAGATVNPTNGIFSWTPTEAQGPGTNVIGIIVTDSGSSPLSATQSFTVTVSEVNQAPALSPIADKAVAELAALTFTNVATDPDLPAQGLAFSLQAGAPAGATVNPTNGIFSWTPTEAQGPGTNVIGIIVTDGGSPPLSATQSFTVTVGEVNQAPVLSPIAGKVIMELSTLAFTNAASDADVPANTLAYSLDPGAPTNAVINPTNGVFTWTPTESQGPGTNVIVVRVTDNGAGALSATQAFTVVVLESNSPPVLAPVAGRTVHVGTAMVITNVATDPDLPANGLTFSLTNAPAGAAINPASGVFTWTPGGAFVNTTNPITVRVTDDGLPPLGDLQVFQVIVRPPPAFSSPPSADGGVMTISWDSIPGQVYRVQFNESLGSTNWVNLLPDVLATNVVASKTDVIGSNTNRFYRVFPLP